MQSREENRRRNVDARRAAAPRGEVLGPVEEILVSCVAQYLLGIICMNLF
jgi:hypothetical protein